MERTKEDWIRFFGPPDNTTPAPVVTTRLNSAGIAIGVVGGLLGIVSFLFLLRKLWRRLRGSYRDEIIVYESEYL